MKIQISPTKKVEGALTIWHEPGEQVDICMDPRSYEGLKFKKNSVKVIYAFGILGETSQKGVIKMLNNFFEILSADGQLYIIEHDFEYINRALIGGDLPIAEFNNSFIRKSYFDQNLLVELLENAGFPRKNQRIWYEDGIKFPKEHYQLIISGIKPKK